MFAIINSNCDRRKVVAEKEKRRRAAEKKIAAAIEVACKRNAMFLMVSAVLGFTSAILGFAGLIPAVASAILGCVFAIAFGWGLNDCAYLLGRCGK